MNIGRGTLMGNPNVVQKVAVVNGLGGGGGFDTGSGGGSQRGERGKRRGGFWRRRGAPDVAATATTGAGSAAKPRMRVYAGGGPADPPRSLSSWRPPTETPRAPGTPGAPVASLAPAASRSGSAFHAVRSEGKGNLAGALFDAAVNAKEVYDNAETQDDKAEGYGAAAGTAAGTLAGAAAGAAIGSVVPLIGTAIGGMIGAWLGSQGGSALGGYVGKSLFGGPEEAVATTPAPVTPLLMAARPGPAVPTLASMGASFEPKGPAGSLVTRNAGSAIAAPDEVAKSLRESEGKSPIAALASAAKDAPAPAKPEPAKVDQKITLSPSFSIVVQGDVKDPREIVNQMMPEIERRLAETAQQVARRDMTDAPVF